MMGDDPSNMSEELPQSERPLSVAPPSVAPPAAPVQAATPAPEPVAPVVEEAPVEIEAVEEPVIEEVVAEEPVAEEVVAEEAVVEEPAPGVTGEDSVAEFAPVHAPEPIGDPEAAADVEVKTFTISPANPDQGPRLVAVADPIGSVETMVYADEVASHPEIVHGDAGLRVLEPIEGVRTPAQILEQVERARAANAALTAQLASAEAA